MNNPEKQQSYNDRDIDGTDRIAQSASGAGDDQSSSIGDTSVVSEDSVASGSNLGLAGRLTDILVGDGDGDLLIQRGNEEDTVMQWLQALDMQVMGACRADERLKPLLKLNVSAGVAEVRLLNHLSQHFEPSEVGLLARCLCIPLVSIRVGKINKEGTLFYPTSTRGNLTLALLPTSYLRISFVGDDGHVERLSTLSYLSDCSLIAIEEIPTDQSGRSFMIKSPDGELFYFWCSEKSRLLGYELLEKMRNLLERKPSLAELTGINDSRLERFATHLRAYLVGTNPQRSSAVARKPVSLTSLSRLELSPSAQIATVSSKSSSHSRLAGTEGAKASSFNQGSLGPRASSFEEGLPRNLASLRNVAREKLRRRGESNASSAENFSNSSPLTGEACNFGQIEMDKLQGTATTCTLPPLSGLESLEKSVDTPFLSPSSQVPPVGGSLSSPYYCWCPISSSLQNTVGHPQMPLLSTETFTLPPLSSLLSAAPLSSGLLTPKPPLNLVDIPSMDFPPFLPDPLIRLPLSMPTSQQIPTFTPLMCDPIVHIPVIDICSSGQAYLVSAGPSMSTAIPPLLPTLVNHPLIQQTESMVDKSARETLRLLISGSSQANSQLMGVLPSVLRNSSEHLAGSRGFHGGVRDVGTIADSIAAMSMVSLPESVMKRCISQSGFTEESGGTSKVCSNNDKSFISDPGEGKAD